MARAFWTKFLVFWAPLVCSATALSDEALRAIATAVSVETATLTARVAAHEATIARLTTRIEYLEQQQRAPIYSESADRLQRRAILSHGVVASDTATRIDERSVETVLINAAFINVSKLIVHGDLVWHGIPVGFHSPTLVPTPSPSSEPTSQPFPAPTGSPTTRFTTFAASSWQACSTVCAAQSRAIACPRNAADNSAAMAACGGGGSADLGCYIGITDKGTNGNAWYCESDGTVVTYKPWDYGEPNMDGGSVDHCVNLYVDASSAGLWNDVQCHVDYGGRAFCLCEQL